MTTMEEVFLKVTAGDEPGPARPSKSAQGDGKLARGRLLMEDGGAGGGGQTSAALRLRQLSAMLNKRKTYWLRNRKMLLIQLLLPVALASIALAIAIQSSAVVVEPSRPMSLSNFASSINYWTEQNTGGDYWFCESVCVHLLEANLVGVCVTSSCKGVTWNTTRPCLSHCHPSLTALTLALLLGRSCIKRHHAGLRLHGQRNQCC